MRFLFRNYINLIVSNVILQVHFLTSELTAGCVDVASELSAYGCVNVPLFECGLELHNRLYSAFEARSLDGIYGDQVDVKWDRRQFFVE